MLNLLKVCLSGLVIGSSGLWVQSAFAAQLGGNFENIVPELEVLAVKSTSAAQTNDPLPDLRVEVESILTPAQVETFYAALEQRESLRNAVNSMNLSTEQVADLQRLIRTHDLTISQVNRWIESDIGIVKVPESSSPGALLALGMLGIGLCRLRQFKREPV